MKSSLAYPNGLTASWTYDANGQLLQVRNATPADVISQYDYAYDNAGRRVSCAKSGSSFTQNDALSYGYNEKSELTNAVAAVDSDYYYVYDFDDIGNRESANERGVNVAYSANNLNQYTAVDAFLPQFDDDGNLILIKTATGIWSVTYNAENRPTCWINGDAVITMSYDRMGRRVTKNGRSFVYDGYLQIANFESSVANSQIVNHNSQIFIWDPAELVATRPLVWLGGASAGFYTHDDNKNVSEIVAANDEIVVHYEYDPFGVVTTQRGTSAIANPWRFSSEYADNDTATVYYNYRHYEPAMGRWLTRDPIDEAGGVNLYVSCCNNLQNNFDVEGLLLDRIINTRVSRYISCVGDCIAKNDPYDVFVDKIVDSLISKFLAESTKVAVGYSGVPKSLLAWMAQKMGNDALAKKISNSAKGRRSKFGWQPLKILRDLLGTPSNRGKIAKAAKGHVYLTIIYGLYLVDVEAYCATYCFMNCDYNEEEFAFMKSIIEFYSDVLSDLFFE